MFSGKLHKEEVFIMQKSEISDRLLVIQVKTETLNIYNVYWQTSQGRGDVMGWFNWWSVGLKIQRRKV